jgi:LPS-assembly protein
MHAALYSAPALGHKVTGDVSLAPNPLTNLHDTMRSYVTNQRGFLHTSRILMCLGLLSVLSSLLSVQAAEPPLPLYIQADYLERRPAENFLRFQGSVDIQYGESRIFADVVELNTETGDGTAEGHVRFEDPQQQITADHAEFNLFTRVGTLYQATGSLRGRSPVSRVGEAAQPVTFYLTAERFVRETEARSRIRRGSLTTCIGPDPVWQFKSRDSVVETEGYAQLSHATFWIKNVPIFYTPYFLFPTKTERATGFLPPGFGTSEKAGFFLDNRFFWAINEQSDSTIGVDYLSKRGIRPNLEYRYALSEADRGQFNGLFLDDDLTGVQFWKISGTSQQHLPGQIRSILTLDLMSQDNYDRTFEVENLLARTRRETNSYLSFIRNWRDAGVELHAQRLEDAENRADERLTRYPDLGFDLLPTPLPWGPFSFGLGALATIFRYDSTEPLGGDLDARRFNILPQLTGTYAYRPWVAITPFVGLQGTVLDQSRQGTEVQSAAQLGAEIRGPQLFRVYGAQGSTQLKHLVEPSITYHWIPHFEEKTRRQPFDIFDDVFPRNDFMFSLTNRLYARTATTEGAFETREFALLRLSQGLDLTGQRGEEFTRLAPGPFFADLTLEARAQVTSTLSLRADVAYDYQESQLDIANAGVALQPWPFWTLFVERRFRRDPNIDFFNGGVALTLPKGWSLTYTTGYNARDNVFAGNSVSALYRSQCWSVSLQMVQRPDDTSFAFQIGLDSFLLPKVGF